MMQATAATGVISGTVVRAGPGQEPMDGARVELSDGPAQVPAQIARTDGAGHFAFTNLPAGSYRLRVAKDGYLRQEYAKRAAIVIKADVPHKSVVFAMEPAPTLGGRVSNESGEPLANIQVQALKAIYTPRGQRMFTVLASTVTDDHGDYRLYWLDEGDYIISATYIPVVKTAASPNEVVRAPFYAPTYYPAASEIEKAQRIPLKAGQNAFPFDFKLIRAPGRTVRGTISTLKNPRVPKINVWLALEGDASSSIRYTAISNDAGDFEIGNVAPGSYVVSAESTIDKESYSASARIVVRDRDENDAGLKLSPGVAAVGWMALDAPMPANLGTESVNLMPLESNLESYISSKIQSDGQFSIAHVQPGAYAADAVVPPDFYIKSERSAQANLLESSLAISWDPPARIEIVLGTDGGRITGTVVDPAGKLFAGAQVVLVPTAERRNRPDQYRAVTSDEEGKFDIRGIPPGEYQLFGWENVEERAWLNPEFIANYRDRSAIFMVPANAVGTVQVPLISETR